MSYTVIFTGSRLYSTYDEKRLVVSRLDFYKEYYYNLLVKVGDCPTGADVYVLRWCIDNLAGHDYQVFRAMWLTQGKKAGPIRNARMVNSGANVCEAFFKHGAENKGTLNTVTLCRDAGIPVIEHWI